MNQYREDPQDDRQAETALPGDSAPLPDASAPSGAAPAAAADAAPELNAPDPSLAPAATANPVPTADVRVPGTADSSPVAAEQVLADADRTADAGAPVDETLRLDDLDPAAAPTAPPSARVGTAAASATAGGGATALGGATETGVPIGHEGPIQPGAGDPADPGTGWGQTPVGSEAVGGPGDTSGAAGAVWGDPRNPRGPGASGGAGGGFGPSGPSGPGASGGSGGGSGPGGPGGPGDFAGPGPAGFAAGDQGSFRRLTREREGRVVAGVAGGLARYLNVDPVILRIAFVGLTLVGGLGLVLYLVAWLMIPERAGVDSPGESVARRLAGAPPWIRVTLLVVGTLIALEALGPVSTVLIVGLLVGLAITASNSRGPNGAAGATADRS